MTLNELFDIAVREVAEIVCMDDTHVCVDSDIDHYGSWNTHNLSYGVYVKSGNFCHSVQGDTPEEALEKFRRELLPKLIISASSRRQMGC